MRYDNIQIGTFLERPNRFIAHIEIEGQQEVVHVKNTGRCKELLIPGATVYVEKSKNPERRTKWDLIGVKKGDRMINMDSQVTNKVVKEWIEAGNLYPDVTLMKPETTYGSSRFDFYVETPEKKAFIEVKGVTLERDNVVLFPDAPSERAVKHVEELAEAVKHGYEAYVFLVIQMKDVRYFTPNRETHGAFADALLQASRAGVSVMAYDCHVSPDSISIGNEVPVVLENPILYEMREPLVDWYHHHKRDLPWRQNTTGYRVWVSEIMLQQTRVEAVKPFYARFMKELPEIEDLAKAPEDKLMKLWEGLGYYNRIRNMQKAANQILIDYQGIFPREYQEIRKLTGIGSYTAGAIASIAFGEAKPAVDGNVLRVISRLLGSYEDIMKASVRTKVEEALESVIPKECPSDFNQGLIELGAIICVPNGMPRCEECPVAHLCQARKLGIIEELPVKTKSKKRKIEKRTVLIFKDGETVAIKKRPAKGLLAGMYELPNVPEHLTMDQAVEYAKEMGLAPVYVEELGAAKHIFSHIEWQMIGYAVRVDELEKVCRDSEMLFIQPEQIQREYAIPAAFEAYTKEVNIILGQEKYEES